MKMQRGNATQTLKKEPIMPLAATGMDLEIIILSGVSQKGITWYHIYVDSNI